jgi:hypothetical protein
VDPNGFVNVDPATNRITVSAATSTNPPFAWILVPMTRFVDHTIVVSRYKEDVGWIQVVPATRIYLYCKSNQELGFLPGNHVQVEMLPNIGREGHTYLFHLTRMYDHLSERVTFLQGCPFDHSPTLLEVLLQEQHFQDVQPLSAYYKLQYDLPPRGVYDSYRYRVTPGGHGDQLEVALYTIDNSMDIVSWKEDGGVKDMQRRWLQQFPAECRNDPMQIIPSFLLACQLGHLIAPRYQFVFCGLISARRGNIRKQDRSVYATIMRELLKYNDQGGIQGYLLERLWYTLFTN